MFDEAGTCQSCCQTSDSKWDLKLSLPLWDVAGSWIAVLRYLSPCERTEVLFDSGLLPLGIYCLVKGRRCCLIVDCCPWVLLPCERTEVLFDSGLLHFGIYCLVKGLRCCLIVDCCPLVFIAL